MSAMQWYAAPVAINCCNHIGESPLWDQDRKRLLWLDQASGVIRDGRSDNDGGWYEQNRWHLNRPLAALVPRRDGNFLLAAGTDLLSFDGRAGDIEHFLSLDIDPQRERLNEAKCDAEGRLWVATLACDFNSRCAGLYRIDPDRTITRVLSQVRVGNGFAWSPDGRTFYFVDSMQSHVDAFDFDRLHGTISGRRSVVTLERCAADGLSVDDEGCLWIAAAGAGEVRRYSPDGELLVQVKIGTPGVTNCTFGDPDLRTLFVTSISVNMPDAALELGIPPKMLKNSEEYSGSIFYCRPGVRGTAAHAFAG